MGQYHLTVNLDKREFVHPHKLASGLKLWEQLACEMGPGKALIILLAHPERRGGGDFDVETDVARRTIGRWRGDRIAIVGDYAEDGDLLHNAKPGDTPASEIYENEAWTDITDDVCAVIEAELGGKFEGDGWRGFKRVDDNDQKPDLILSVP